VLFFGVLSLVVMLSVLLLVNGSYEQKLEKGEAVASTTTKTETEGGVLENLVDSLNIAVAS